MALGLGIAVVATRPAEAVAMAVLGGLGFACVQVIPFPLMLEMQPPGREGALSGIFHALIDLAQLASLLVVGALVSATGSYRAAYWVGLAAVALAFALLRSVPAPSPARAA
jgi:hypothetical protein